MLAAGLLSLIHVRGTPKPFYSLERLADAFRGGRVFQGLLEGEFGTEFYSAAALGTRDFAKIGVGKVSVRIIELRRVGYAEGLGTQLQPGALGNSESAKDSGVKI